MQINSIAIAAAAFAVTAACASAQNTTSAGATVNAGGATVNTGATVTTPATPANTATPATTPTTQDNKPAKPAKKKTDPKATRITADEAMGVNVPTAYEVISRLHPQWYRHVGGEGTSTPIVYVNNQRQEGALDALKQVSSSDIIQIDYVKPSEAMMKYGPDAKGGTILVLRK